MHFIALFQPIFAALGYRVAFVDLQPDWISTKDLEAAPSPHGEARRSYHRAQIGACSRRKAVNRGVPQRQGKASGYSQAQTPLLL